MNTHILALLVAAGLALSTPAMSQDIDFGDDSGEWANDGECDDKRFEGAGMTDTVLLDEDIGHDATDCRKAFKAGTIRLRQIVTEDLIHDGINFGTDSGDWANDNECDDPRFIGEGMASELLKEDIRADASDCHAAYLAGRIELVGE